MGFGKDGKGVILNDVEIATSLGTLGSLAAIVLAGPSMEHKFRILRTDVQCFIIDAANAKDVTGLMFGIANGDLSATEISAKIVTNPVAPQDRPENEVASRNVKILGVLKTDGPEARVTFQFWGPEGQGPYMTNKHRWTYHSPDAWNWFIFNGGSTAMTTGALATLIATHYGVWVD